MSPPGHDASCNISAALASAAIWARSDSSLYILRLDAGVQLLSLSNFRVQAVKFRDTRRNEVRRRFSIPTILQALGFLLSLASAAPNVHRGDIGDGDLNLCVGFDIEWLRRGSRIDFLAVLLNPQVKASFRSHRHDKTDVQRAARSVELCGELTHRAESTRNRNRNRSALRGQPLPVLPR